jgi:tetratricopeptide (TPR) repeat protein
VVLAVLLRGPALGGSPAGAAERGCGRPGAGEGARCAAIIAWGNGNTAEARPLAEEAVALCRVLDAPRELTLALMQLGSDVGNDQPAVEAMYAEALRLFEQGADPWWVALARLCHGIVAAQLGDVETAWSEAAWAAERFERLDDPFLLALARLQLGFAQLLLGRPTEARVQLEYSLPVFREFHDWRFSGLALIGLGSAARAVDDHRAAASAYAEALALCRDTGSAGDLPLCLEGLAAAAFGLGQVARAARLLGAAEAAHVAGFIPSFPGFEQAYQATARAVAGALGAQAFAAASVPGRSLSPTETLAEARSMLAKSASYSPPTGGDRPAAADTPPACPSERWRSSACGPAAAATPRSLPSWC